MTLIAATSGRAQQPGEAPAEPEQVAVETHRDDDIAMNEDPEQQGRLQEQLDTATTEPGGDEQGQLVEEERERPWEFYGSVRVHAVNTYDAGTFERSSDLADGVSRVGLRAHGRIATTGSCSAARNSGSMH